MTNADYKRFTQALRLALGPFAGAVSVTPEPPEPWASGTYEGARCVMCITIEGTGAAEVADRFLADLGEHEWAVPGHVVADLGLLDDARRDGGTEVVLRLEALLIEAD